MKENHTKKIINISVDRNLDDLLEKLFGNKSKYVEYLILQDMKKHLTDEQLKNIDLL